MLEIRMYDMFSRKIWIDFTPLEVDEKIETIILKQILLIQGVMN